MKYNVLKICHSEVHYATFGSLVWWLINTACVLWNNIEAGGTSLFMTSQASIGLYPSGYGFYSVPLKVISQYLCCVRKNSNNNY